MFSCLCFLDINSYNKLAKQSEQLNEALADAQLNYDKKQNDIIDKINTINDILQIKYLVKTKYHNDLIAP